MEPDTDDAILNQCRKEIEAALGWEDGEKWSTRDFETLSHKIQEATGVSLSIATLKRIWGKIRYDSKPTSTTLNTLAKFLGYEDWRDFKKRHADSVHVENGVHIGRKPRSYVWVSAAIVLLVAGVTVWLLAGSNTRMFRSEEFAFSSRKVVDQGVPNSVVFDYDASAASSGDSIFIRQSWDKNRTTRVSRTDTQHTSIYYLPGFFEAKLVVNNQIVREHDLLITTGGWMAAIERAGVPVYIESKEIISESILTLPVDKISENNIPLSPDVPFIGFHYFKEFPGASTKDLAFEASVRNDYNKGSGACQYAEIRIQFSGPAVMIPLSAKGCVSNLSFAGIDGRKRDLSAFGRNMSDWVRVKCTLSDNQGELFIDDEPIMKFRIPGKEENFVGLGFRFQGAGSVDDVRVYEKSGRVIFEDTFDKD